MPKKIDTSSQVQDRTGIERSGLKYLIAVCSLSAVASACVGVVDDTGNGTGGASGVTTAGSSNAGSLGNTAGSAGSVSGSGNAGASNGAAGSSFGGTSNAGTSNGGSGGSGNGGSSFGGTSNGGTSNGGTSNGGRNAAGNGAGGRAGAGAGGRNGGNGGTSSGGTSSGGRSSGGASSGGMTSGTAGSTAVVCTSNTTWTTGNNANMRPGNACLSCHNFTVAGTIYPTAHEPNNCNGTNGLTSGVKVLIKGANGTTVTLTPGSTGNFFSQANITKPYTVTVTGTGGAMRSMLTPQTNGDCNACHTQNGAMAAPGRIMSP